MELLFVCYVCPGMKSQGSFLTVFVVVVAEGGDVNSSPGLWTGRSVVVM